MCQLHESESQRMGGGWVEDEWEDEGRRERRRDGGVGLAAALPGRRVTLFALQ